YIRVRLAVAGKETQDAFPTETIHAIHICSGGIPRVVNLLCENALISAYAEGAAAVSVEMVRSVAADFDFETTNLPSDPSAVPVTSRIDVKLERSCNPASPPGQEFVHSKQAETDSQATPAPSMQPSVGAPIPRAAAPIVSVEQPKSNAVAVEFARTRPPFFE